MAGYSGTPLWKKLGYKTGMSAYVDGGPRNYRSWLALPADVHVKWLTPPKSRIEFVHLFAISASKLKARLKSYRTKIVPNGVIWVSWPKKSSGVKTDITEDTIRDVALPMGLVDIKVCAVDEVWSGLKLVIRKEKRTAKAVRVIGYRLSLRSWRNKERARGLYR
jgi:hypothetical protein